LSGICKLLKGVLHYFQGLRIVGRGLSSYLQYGRTVCIINTNYHPFSSSIDDNKTTKLTKKQGFGGMSQHFSDKT
jgi:hypothetical protein